MGLLDLSSDPSPSPKRSNVSLPASHAPAGPETKKFLGIKFNCCGMYARIYVNRDGTAYEGRCPKCMQPVKLKIGPGGTDHRFFEVD